MKLTFLIQFFFPDFSKSNQDKGLELEKVLINQNLTAGQEARFKCTFRCFSNDRCDLHHASVRWYKNEAPLKNRKSKIEARVNRSPHRLSGKSCTVHIANYILLIFFQTTYNLNP